MQITKLLFCCKISSDEKELKKELAKEKSLAQKYRKKIESGEDVNIHLKDINRTNNAIRRLEREIRVNYSI